MMPHAGSDPDHFTRRARRIGAVIERRDIAAQPWVRVEVALPGVLESFPEPGARHDSKLDVRYRFGWRLPDDAGVRWEPTRISRGHRPADGPDAVAARLVIMRAIRGMREGLGRRNG